MKLLAPAKATVIGSLAASICAGGCLDRGQLIYENSTEILVPAPHDVRLSTLQTYLESEGYSVTQSSTSRLTASLDNVTVWPPFGHRKRAEVSVSQVDMAIVAHVYLACRYVPLPAKHPWNDVPSIVAAMEKERQTIIDTIQRN